MRDKNGKIDKIVGNIKENTGKAVGSEQLELHGKLQKKRGEAKEAAHNVKENLKEKLAEKVNDFIDKNDKKHK